MVEELGKIEKMPVDSYKKGRKLFFVPMVYSSKELPEEYSLKIQRYWEQVQRQITDLSAKLGAVNCLYHELVASDGEEGCKAVKEIDEEGYTVIKSCMDAAAKMQAVEDADTLTEFMDWSRCLYIGLENPRVMQQVYEYYSASLKKRNDSIAKKIDDTLGENQIGILVMRENHQVQFPRDIQIFYVAPPALEDIKRWIREQENLQKQPGAGGEKASS